MPGNAERSMLASIAANERWSKVENRNAATQAAREGFNGRFEKMVDPNGELPADERARRAEAAKKAHMTRLALASARSRRAKAATRASTRKYRETAEALRKTADELDRLAVGAILGDQAIDRAEDAEEEAQ